jgi:hypothetical protein
MDIRPRDRGPECIEIGLAIGDHGHHGSGRQHRLGIPRRLDPVPRLLFLQRPTGVVALRRRRARPRHRTAPQAAANQPQAFTGAGIQRDHRMQQQAAPNPFADGAQAAIMTGTGSEIKFSRVLDRQHMAACRRRCGAGTPSRDETFHRYLGMPKQPPEAKLDRFAALGQATQATRAQMHHPFEKQRPPLSRRRSPNSPRLPTMSHPVVERADIGITSHSLGARPDQTLSQHDAQNTGLMYIP